MTSAYPTLEGGPFSVSEVEAARAKARSESALCTSFHTAGRVDTWVDLLAGEPVPSDPCWERLVKSPLNIAQSLVVRCSWAAFPSSALSVCLDSVISAKRNGCYINSVEETTESYVSKMS